MLTVNKHSSIIDYFTTLLSQKLQAGESVLWLLSGGDAIKVQAKISQELQDTDMSRLVVTLMDERYGTPGYSDENWQQLLDAGFTLPGATTYRILRGMSRQETARHFEAFLRDAFLEVDYSVGLFGLGTDGHTAGIKPDSQALDAQTLVSNYAGEDFERITITPRGIEMLDEAVLYIEGHETDAQMETLLQENRTQNEQPAQLLKHVPKSTVFLAI